MDFTLYGPLAPILVVFILDCSLSPETLVKSQIVYVYWLFLHWSMWLSTRSIQCYQPLSSTVQLARVFTWYKSYLSCL